MKIKAKILSPIHISSGEEYEKNFNFFIQDNCVYLIDEFKVLEKIPYAYKKDDYKMVLTDKAKEEIIKKNFYIRRIETKFKAFEKPLIEHISSNSKPFIPASSLKGAIRTAIINCFKNYNKEDYSNRCDEVYSFYNQNCDMEKKDKNYTKVFKNILIKEIYPKFSTKVYKTINMKVCKDFQEKRVEKVEKISNFVEAIEPNQEFIFEIKDKKNILRKLALIANEFYQSKLQDDIKKIIYGCRDNIEECSNFKDNAFENYFYKKDFINTDLQLNEKRFLLNVGRFGGAVKKSIDNQRKIKNSHCNDKRYVTTKTFALEKECVDNTYYENCLIPFGWIVCEIIK